MGEVSRETRPPAEAAARVFAEQLDRAEEYVRWLRGEGITRGLIGPREAPRLWERHVLNCAVAASALHDGVHVADVGSGAGLPGLVWAIARPDLLVTLIEPSGRRTAFLTEVVESLGLESRVCVWRGRAQEHRRSYPIVTARAVTRLDRLARWCLPLVSDGGQLLALKGASAQQELDATRSTIKRWGGTSTRIRTYGGDILPVPTTVIEVDKA